MWFSYQGKTPTAKHNDYDNWKYRWCLAIETIPQHISQAGLKSSTQQNDGKRCILQKKRLVYRLEHKYILKSIKQ